MTPSMYKVRDTYLKIRVAPAANDLDTTIRKACDPRSCLFNLSFARALAGQLEGTVTNVWVDAGHHRFSLQVGRARHRWSADTPRWVKNILIALDRWDRRGRKAGKPCPIQTIELKPYTLACRRLYAISPQTKAQKDAAYARVKKQREEGKVFKRRRSLHDRVVGYA